MLLLLPLSGGRGERVIENPSDEGGTTPQTLVSETPSIKVVIIVVKLGGAGTVQAVTGPTAAQPSAKFKVGEEQNALLLLEELSTPLEVSLRRRACRRERHSAPA